VKRKILVAFVIAVCIAGAAAAGYYTHYIRTPIDDQAREEVVRIPPGTGFAAIRDRLDELGLVKNRWLFHLYVHLKGQERHIRSGEYLLSSSMTPHDLLGKLVRGEVMDYRVSFPEGFTVEQIAARLEKRGLADAAVFMKNSRDRDFLRSLGIDGETAEGFLFPETYRFTRSMSERDMIRAMVEEFHDKLTLPMKRQIADAGMTLVKFVTLASIVEKESGVEEEKPLIAAVFLNRLKKHMRLQSDPTVIYGLDDFDGNLTREHLETNNPYNTYRIRALPPGPICNPGLSSMTAVLSPADVDYLYFVSRNDGTHHFSSDLKSHNEAVITYQIKRRRTR